MYCCLQQVIGKINISINWRIKLTLFISGFVENVNAEVVARLVSAIGGSRKKTGDFIDFSVGLQLFVDVGDHIKSG